MGRFRTTVQALLAVAASIVTTSAIGVRPGQIKNLVTFGDSYTDVVFVWDGGDPWPVYTSRYAHLDLIPFARSGATCSNNITFRPFPSLFESQLPEYFSQKGSLRLAPQETIYTLWIGTNDVGANALLTGNDDASIVDVSACMVNWVKALYESGARNFLFQNVSFQVHPEIDQAAKRILQQVLGRRTKRDSVERIHDRACTIWKCYYQIDVGSTCPKAPY